MVVAGLGRAVHGGVWSEAQAGRRAGRTEQLMLPGGGSGWAAQGKRTARGEQLSGGGLARAGSLREGVEQG
jgi:hypothetical protein